MSLKDAFIDYIFESDGTYIIAVGAYDTEVDHGGLTGKMLEHGNNYWLQVSRLEK